MQGGPREFELKLELAETLLPNVASVAASKRLRTGKPRKNRLLSIYFDTPKHALRRAGISLRLRRVDGSWVQTVKLGTSVQGGVSNRTELEATVPSKTPCLDLIAGSAVRKTLRKLIANTSLIPVFQTDIVRVVHGLKSAGTEAELALDSGCVRSATQTAAICEAELELKSGGVEQLLVIAQQLFAGIPFCFSSQSKSERGYGLAELDQVPGHAPIKAPIARLHPSNSVADAFASICQSTVDQILGNWKGIQYGDDPEFAHQMRVGLRRLRTTLRIFRPVIDNETMRGLTRDLRRMGRRVGELRDADVLLADIAQPVLQSSVSQDGAQQLEELLERHCHTARDSLREEFRQTCWNELLLQVSMLPHGAGWSKDVKNGGKISRYARKALKKCWQTVARQAQDLNVLTIEERHALRKDLKTLRYTVEFFAPVLSAGKCRKFIGRLKVLQDSFGYLNDVALAQTLPEIVANAPKQSPELHQAVGYLLGWHSRHADDEWRKTQQQWRQLEQQPKPWN